MSLKIDQISISTQEMLAYYSKDWATLSVSGVYETVFTTAAYEGGVITAIVKYFDGAATSYRKIEKIYQRGAADILSDGTAIGDTVAKSIVFQFSGNNIQVALSNTLTGTQTLSVRISLQRYYYV